MIPKLPKGFSHPMVVGTGSFSSVYRARQSALDRWVAIKILPEAHPERRQSLLKEAQTQAQMSIGCIPAVYDAFEWRKQVCIVMQWVKGVSLHSLLEHKLGHGDRQLLAAAMIESLAGLHRLGYAHRDLKPANILISPNEGMFLVDFGFSKSVADGERSLATTVKGSPAYMAPELWQPGLAVDYLKADLFALGKIFRFLNPGPVWEELIQSLLADDPALRPASAQAVWIAWQPFLVSMITRDWISLAGPAASEHLAAHLLSASKSLLHSGRNEEAYWLLSECLEENPDSVEAMGLMAQIPVLSRKKAQDRRLVALFSGLAITAAVILAFYFGRQIGGKELDLAEPKEQTTKAFFLPPPGHALRTHPSQVFREFSKPENRLSGWLVIENADICDSLLLDGQLINQVKFHSGTSIRYGDHMVVCRDPSVDYVRREKFRVLPFQRKIIRMAWSQPARSKG